LETLPKTGEIVYQSGTSQYSVTVYDNGDRYLIDSYSFDGHTPVSFALIFNYNSGRYTTVFQSSLFTKHFPDREYVKQFYGVLIDPGEIGTYNYLLNEITGKYIFGLGGEDEICPNEKISVEVEKELLPDDFSKFHSEIIERKQ